MKVEDKTPGLATAIARGVVWTALSRLTAQVLRLGRTVVLARLLTPSDFGLVGMVGFFTGLVGVVAELGLPTAVVREKELDREKLSSLFWLVLMLGVGASVLLGFGAPLVVWVYGETRLHTLVVVAALTLVATAGHLVPNSLLNKEMRFKTLFYPDFAYVSIMGVVAIVLAWYGYGPLSLVLGALVAAILRTALFWSLHTFRPMWHYRYADVRSLISFGWRLVVSAALNYTCLNLDFFFVGVFLGSKHLGLYTIAFNLVNYPQAHLAALINKVAFPAYARIQDEATELAKATRTIVSSIALATFPLLCGLACVADLFVPLVFGHRWQGSVLPVRILCLGGLAFAVAPALIQPVLARGRSDLAMKLSFFKFLFLAVVMPIAASRGSLEAVALTMSLYAWLVLSIHVLVARSVVGVGFLEIARGLLPALALSGAMASGVLLGRAGLGARMVPLGELAASVTFGAILYIAGLAVFQRPWLHRMAGLLRSALAPEEDGKRLDSHRGSRAT